MTPIGWDETWVVSIASDGHFKLVVQEDGAYTNPRLCEKQLTGQWRGLETSAEHFLVLVTETQWQILYSVGALPPCPPPATGTFRCGAKFSL
ncbi:MAG: hypothetical protein JNL09_01750 [Anaerolineales bacterium]|nr:hypothetical protein [Anaerolineales bacterium]